MTDATGMEAGPEGLRKNPVSSTIDLRTYKELHGDTRLPTLPPIS